MDKFDRTEWGKITNDGGRSKKCLKSDLNTDCWSDFENDKDEVDRIEYRGVPPDQAQIDELSIELESDDEGDFAW